MTPRHLLAALALAACTPHVAPTPTSSTSSDITEADLRARLYAIADDSMMGRETGSEGAYKASAYVAAEFARLGLKPAGENGTWFQVVPFWTMSADPSARIDAAGATLSAGRDFLVQASPRVALDATPVVYGGRLDDTTHWITASAATGKLVVLDVPSTQFRLPLARWRGAAAVALVGLDGMAAERSARLREGFPVSDTTSLLPVPMLWISRRAATSLLGADPATLAPGASGATPVRGTIGMTFTPVRWPARNVVAVLPGSDPELRGEYVALTAHHDHVGFDHAPVDHDSLRAFNRVIRPMGADSPPREPTADEWRRIRSALDSLRRLEPPRPDSIRNGADDDGSGTVSILEIAERMSRGGTHPRRSILFVSHTAEEAGLLGSRWYSDHPTVPRDSIVAELDQDMVGRGTASDMPRGGTGAGSDTYLEVVGAKRLSRSFGEMVEAANARQPIPFVFNYEYDAPGHPLQYYCRADHYSYARYGIPSLAMSRGEHLDYHQVTDEAQYISYRDLARVSRMVFDAAMSIANADARPALDAPKQADPHAPCRQ